jgi:putative FmdB family regulatory protein
MPNYEFKCKKKKCSKVFSEICTLKEFEAGFPDVLCPDCGGTKVEKLMNTRVGILNSTDKMNNFEYAAEKNFEKAQVESMTAKEEAAKRGITSPYAELPDFTDNGNRMNFVE